MKPIRTPQQAIENMKDGCSIMVGGFISAAAPAVLDAIYGLRTYYRLQRRERAGIIKLVMAGGVLNSSAPSGRTGSWAKMKSDEVKIGRAAGRS